ncbi:outer membrane efflux protein [Cystobacter fuscus DSM 2262]|uniref:Outer membrane efflux protein n=1 Tax=Cystobacter fuscus (strain ATCC 25194 / DSM 2262 / NBRC 100088 / M29) TaxID=1242864 RepID=S9PC50_CYSF2|nr:TolC family protein [Cystobacter fuscus]EPX61970.1 outer membrane efflux protein [Cystobacter fuscus DSM 2262]
MNAFLLAAVLAAAPTPIQLEEARARSRENTQSLTALLQVAAAEQDVRIARSSLLPQVGFQVGATGVYSGPSRDYNVVPSPEGGYVNIPVDVPAATFADFGLSVSIRQVIYDRSIWARLEQSGAQLESQRGQALEDRDASEQEGIQRFFLLYRTQSTIQVLQANVKRSEEQLERARALFVAGRVGKAEELSAQVNLGNDRIAVVARQSQLAGNQVQLATWLALPGAEEVTAVEPELLRQTPEPVMSLPQALEEARARRPLLVALRERLRAAELQERIAHSGFLPRLSLSVDLQRGGPDADIVFLQPRLQNSVRGGIALSWDLFNGWATTAQQSQARTQSRVAELNLRQAERDLEGQVRQAHATVEAQLVATELAEANRKAAADSLTLASERFNAGVSSTLEVRDAQLKLTQAELTLLENRIDVEIARFALMRAMGTLNPGEAK